MIYRSVRGIVGGEDAAQCIVAPRQFSCVITLLTGQSATMEIRLLADALNAPDTAIQQLAVASSEPSQNDARTVTTRVNSSRDTDVWTPAFTLDFTSFPAAFLPLLALLLFALAVSGILVGSTAVKVQGPNTPAGDNSITLRMSTQDIDLTNRMIQANVLPIPHGDLVGNKSGEISQNLRIEIASGGITTSVVTIPGESIIDPTALTLALERGDSDYPFDHPFANYQLSVPNDDTGRAVPFVLELSNSARPWVLSAVRGEQSVENGRTLVPITIEGSRDPLTITLVLFYVLAILLTTLMAVVIIGSAIIRRRLEFANVIWLSATLLSFPGLRGAMPGAWADRNGAGFHRPLPVPVPDRRDAHLDRVLPAVA